MLLNVDYTNRMYEIEPYNDDDTHINNDDNYNID